MGAAPAVLYAVTLLFAAIGLMRALRPDLVRHAGVGRNAVFAAIGFFLLSFPWLFMAAWPGIALCLLAAVALWVADSAGNAPSGSDDERSREKRLDWLFPIAAAIIIAIARRDQPLYVVPVLIVTLPAALRAMAGAWSAAGANRAAGDPSRAASIGFTTCAIGVYAALAAMGTTVRGADLAIALTFGLLAMLAANVAWRGTDRLLVPLGAALLMRSLLELPPGALYLHLAIAALLTSAALLAHALSEDREGVRSAAVLAGFLIWTAGGWEWLVAPVALFATYPFAWPGRQPEDRPYTLQRFAAWSAAGLLWLFVAVMLDLPDQLFGFSLTYAVVACAAGFMQMRAARPQAPLDRLLSAALVIGWCTVLLPYLLIDQPGRAALAAALFAPFALLLGISMVSAARRRIAACLPRAAVQYVAVLAASATGAAIYYALGMATR